MDEVEVLVVGAGPTGLVAASRLAAHGVRFRIVEKLAARSRQSRALGVHARSLELFQKMGVVDALLARGIGSLGINLWVRGHRAAHVRLDDIGSVDTPYPFIFFVPQPETEAVLESHLNGLGARVERSTELVGLEQDGQGVTATVRTGAGAGERIRARYVIGCDGAHSLVRKTAGMRFEGAAYPQVFTLADARISGLDVRDELHVFMGRRGLVVIFPLPGHSSCRLMVSRSGEADTASADPTAAEMEALARETGQAPLRIEQAEWTARFRIHHRGVDRYRAGRLFVAGDAAHIHSPAGGQGMNTGIQDAFNLAWKLALVLRGHAGEALLDSYQAERWPVGQRLLKVTDRLFSAAASPRPAVIALRNLLAPRLVPPLLQSRRWRARVFHFVSQLGIRYRRSPVVAEAVAGADETFLEGPRAGNRAPDGLLRLAGAPGADLGLTTLFEHLRHTRHHLLAFRPEPDGVDRRALEALLRPYRGLIEATWIFGKADNEALLPGDARGEEELLRRYGLLESARTLKAWSLAARPLRHGRHGPGATRPGSAATYLVRPDGYLAFRSWGTSFEPLERFLGSYLRPAP